ncbi:MAG: helix-turn-helix domain-containing protein, partial [Acidobacteriota bacterium]
GHHVIQVDVRVVAASNRDLQELLELGKFRKDLFYRLSVVHLEVPPLRERSDDIPQLANHFLQQSSERTGRQLRISPEALQALMEYDWPGNVRELENVIERVAVLKTDLKIGAEDLAFLQPAQEPDDLSLNELGLVEREKIVEVLRECSGNKAEAARRLGIERKSLYRKAKRLGIDLEKVS